MATTRTARRAGGALLEIQLDDPRANVLSMAMMAEIAEALGAARNDETLKLVVFSATGDNFSFGASVPEHRRETAPAMLASFHRLVRDVVTYPVPVASLVAGRCLGGAFELVLASHLVFATTSAVFACPEIKLGVFPPVLSVLGPARLGGALSERMLLTGAELDARRAHAAGFVAELVPDGHDREAWLLEWFNKTLAPLSSFALREATFASRHGSPTVAAAFEPLAAVERRYIERVLTSHDGNEGIEAFVAKRAPTWTGS